MEKVFAQKLGFLPDQESEFLILDQVELIYYLFSNFSVGKVGKVGNVGNVGNVRKVGSFAIGIENQAFMLYID